MHLVGSDLTEVSYQGLARSDPMLQKAPAGRFGVLDLPRSDAAHYVTGQLLYINGGYMASI